MVTCCLNQNRGRCSVTLANRLWEGSDLPRYDLLRTVVQQRSIAWRLVCHLHLSKHRGKLQSMTGNLTQHRKSILGLDLRRVRLLPLCLLNHLIDELQLWRLVCHLVLNQGHAGVASQVA